jgi:glycosyltransferase involved in cell wall biosynthesis
MKVLIFTPTIKASAIGRMASLVTKALIAEQHEVVIVRTECEAMLASPSHDFGAEIIAWSDGARVLEEADKCDALIYQIGNSYEYHEGCVRWLDRLPGIVCLHDFYLVHLFHGWARTNREKADSILRESYGEEVARRFFNFNNGETLIEDTKDCAPMTEWIASQAVGVVTHSHWGVPRVAASCPGPVRVVPLAYDAPIVLHGAVPNSYGRMRLLTIGHINPNKRVANVIRAIAASTVLRQNVVYRLVGLITAESVLELSTLANALRVNLLISGHTDDSGLAHAIGEADVISCLRWPSLEAASASAIEAMLYGKPTIVTDSGFYSEIPDDCVEKISHQAEVKNICAVLERLYAEPDARNAMGARAQRWASATYTATEYARKLIDMSAECCKEQPVMAANAYFLRVLKKWGATEDLLCTEEVKKLLRN